MKKYIPAAAVLAVSLLAFTGCSDNVSNNAGRAWDGYGTDYNYGSDGNGNGYGYYGNGYYDGTTFNYGSSSDGMADNDYYRTTYGPYGYRGNNGLGLGKDYLSDDTNGASSVLPYDTTTGTDTAANSMVN